MRVTEARARKARLHQSYPPDHPKIVEAGEDLQEAKLGSAIERALADAPPLSPERRARLAALLAPYGDAA